MLRQLTSALKFKSEFAANITHEIRTPIYAFIGFAELLLEQVMAALTSSNSKSSGGCWIAPRVCFELVNNILDHAKLEAGLRCG